MRLIPFGRGLSPAESVVQQHGVAQDLWEGAWEVGRLVLAPAYRSRPAVLRACFALILMRFIEVAPTANFFATCSPALSRLYRRFGFSVLVKDAVQTAEGSFYLIHGSVPSVRLAVATEGLASQRLVA